MINQKNIPIDTRLARRPQFGPDPTRAKPPLGCTKMKSAQMDRLRVLASQAAGNAGLKPEWTVLALICLTLFHMKKLLGGNGSSYLPRGYTRAVQEEMEQRFRWRPSSGIIRWYDGMLRNNPRYLELMQSWEQREN